MLEKIDKSKLVISFQDMKDEEFANAGGKGGNLALLYQSKFPVPEGFIILPHAFDGDKIHPEAWIEIQENIKRITRTNKKIAFAVRSSALAEDSVHASFGGQFETVLGVKKEEELLQAIYTVRQSRLSERVQVYSKAKGMDFSHEIAVVVQEMVPSTLSGVVFTRDPITGANQIVGNYIHGLGEKLVSGEVDAYEFSLQRPKGRYKGPEEFKQYAQRLYKLALNVEKKLGNPQDIEWAIANNKLYLLQSRPITTLIAHDSERGEMNATFTGDYLWTNMMDEVFPIPTTPSTCSIWQIVFDMMTFGDIPGFQHIAGRPYLNYSMMYSMLLKLLRSPKKVQTMLKEMVGSVPEDIGEDIPLMPISLKTFLFQVVPTEMKKERIKKQFMNNIEEFLAEATINCSKFREQIQTANEASELAVLWLKKIKPHLINTFLLQDTLNESFLAQSRRLKKNLSSFLGETDANTFFSSISGRSEELASIGPLLGLAKIQEGKITRKEYLQQYGHRGPYENYLFKSRPYEDPNWLDEQLEEFKKLPIDITELLKKRSTEFGELRQKIRQQLSPRKMQFLENQISQFTETCSKRENVRSELTRIISVIRDLYLQAGMMTGLDERIFFLDIDELLDILSGKEATISYISVRQETYKKYCELPPLPAWIRGRFDPFQWAKDPNRRVDVFNAQQPVSSKIDSGNIIQGNPGSAGRVEGIVRRINSPEEWDQLKAGEILVTHTTNVGWTPLFPRAAAVITDIGAILSHAAIVARELAIPAVVGCVDATHRLKTGDRILVDGSQGTVEILQRA
ncbi:MAG: PEP/pyruvate-binding domain-containing protein [Candidatus Hodarchaeota archaeon]